MKHKVGTSKLQPVEKASKGLGKATTSAFKKKGGKAQGDPCCHTKLD